MSDAVVSLETQPELRKVPLVQNERSLSWITQKVSEIPEARTPLWWWLMFFPCALLALVGLTMIGYQISNGVGVWGENKTVGWAWDITNFVFWIGIGHAGTLISAILFLSRQRWRTSINRAAEAMTLFAVICAAIFPGIHVGRVWMAWYLAPVPNSYGIWPNFRSPLLWDVFAVSTYFTVSVLFWYTGLVPDLASLRDRAKSRVKKFVYGVFALGWRGSNRQWRHYEMAYLLLAGLSTPLVLSVHSVVSFDFATSILPGWHTTIFPPYFVAGAIFGGFAMVLTIMLPARLLYPQLDDMVTREHVDKMAKIILLTGSIVGYAYLMELFIAYYGQNKFEMFTFFHQRASLGMNKGGYYNWAYYCMMTCNVISPQVFWMKWARRNYIVVFIICMFVNAGMWFERFVIIATSLAQDFLPSSWHHYHPSWVEIWTFCGTFGIFLSLFLLFMRYLPMICAFEVKAVTPFADPHRHEPGHVTHASVAGPATGVLGAHEDAVQETVKEAVGAPAETKPDKPRKSAKEAEKDTKASAKKPAKDSKETKDSAKKSTKKKGDK
jgi:molybdopterin-containing oxidoreductase family membrane subunit